MDHRMENLQYGLQSTLRAAVKDVVFILAPPPSTRSPPSHHSRRHPHRSVHSDTLPINTRPICLYWRHYMIYSVSQKNPPSRGPDIFSFFDKRLRICKRFFTHLLNVPIFARLQIFIQLSPILTKLCHIKHDYTVHIICAKCPKRTKTRAFRRLRKSLIALLIVVCGKSL